MVEGRLIVCVASAWDYDPTSKHQIMKILSRYNSVLWINYHGSRRPEINSTDLRDSWSALRRVARGLHQVSPSMVQFTPMVIPGATNPLLQRLHERVLVSQIRRAIRSVAGTRKDPIQVWTFAPDVPNLVGAFDEECFVYYCVDEYTRFEGFNSQRIKAAEDQLIDRADVVIVTSDPLLKTKGIRRPDAILVRHGVDYDHFASAWRLSLPCPPDLAAIPRPILGFFGLLHHWVDQALLAEVARLRPLYSFVLIGDSKVDLSELEALDNVFLLGRRPYEDLPSYCAAFDSGMLLFAPNAMTHNVNPVKMYEYLAAGLPIVSTPLPEARRYKELITIADTPERFAAACDHVLVAFDKGDREEISRSVQSETWLSKVEFLSEIVMARHRVPRCVSSKLRADVVPWGGTSPEIVATQH